MTGLGQLYLNGSKVDDVSTLDHLKIPDLQY